MLSDAANSRDSRGCEIREAIRRILLHDWDPIGVADEMAAQDEYDSYIGEVYRMVACRTSALQITDYLYRIETEWMGLSPIDRTRLLPVGEKLAALASRLQSSDEDV